MTGGWRLVVRRETETVAETELPLGVSSLGRSAANRVVLDGPRVSRFHAALFVSPDGACHLQDLGSRNGTLLQDRRVGRVRLAPGATFRVGPFTCQALATGRPPGAAAEPSTVADTDAASDAIDDGGTFLGTGAAARKLLAQARRAAATSLNVLITGETGSGKGVIASLVHRWSGRRQGPFVVVNCAAIPAELVESELFGHVRGSFTGAVADRPGKFRSANGGTLFLDEIGDLPLPAQAKILRAIEDQEIEPIGERSPVHVDVRVLAATHQDLESAVAEKRFRMDLHHRLSTVRLHVPPLRERREDLAVLAHWFLSELIDDIPWAGHATFSKDAIDALVAHDWPGNVRELRNVVAQGLLASHGHVISASDLTLKPPAAATIVPATATMAEAEAAHLARSLAHHDGNLRRTAKALGISRSTLHERMDRLGLRRPARRSDADVDPDAEASSDREVD